eukprot:1030200-Amphidinium_carterae.1
MQPTTLLSLPHLQQDILQNGRNLLDTAGFRCAEHQIAVSEPSGRTMEKLCAPHAYLPQCLRSHC